MVCPSKIVYPSSNRSLNGLFAGNGVTPMYFVALDGYLQGTILGYSREWVESRTYEKPS